MAYFFVTYEMELIQEYKKECFHIGFILLGVKTFRVTHMNKLKPTRFSKTQLFELKNAF